MTLSDREIQFSSISELDTNNNNNKKIKSIDAGLHLDRHLKQARNGATELGRKHALIVQLCCAFIHIGKNEMEFFLHRVNKK